MIRLHASYFKYSGQLITWRNGGDCLDSVIISSYILDRSCSDSDVSDGHWASGKKANQVYSELIKEKLHN